MSNKLNRKLPPETAKNSEAGFTMIEMVVAILIITIGLLGTCAAVTFAVQFGMVSRHVTASKQIIISSIEEVETLRNSRRLDFKQIANVGAVDNSGCPNSFNGFSNGYKPISTNPGPDGVNGTDDDLLDAGADGIYGTGDDFTNATLAKGGYTRQITVSELSDTLKKVEIKVQYYTPTGKTGEIRGVCYLNDEYRITR